MIPNCRSLHSAVCETIFRSSESVDRKYCTLRNRTCGGCAYTDITYRYTPHTIPTSKETSHSRESYDCAPHTSNIHPSIRKWVGLSALCIHSCTVCTVLYEHCMLVALFPQSTQYSSAPWYRDQQQLTLYEQTKPTVLYYTNAFNISLVGRISRSGISICDQW